MKVDDAFASTQVLSLAGDPIELGTLWEDKPVVLVWVRHYG
mgnify:CR=1 FL=1